MIRKLQVEAFLDHPAIMVDVRSPGEFAESHISGACNIPLLSDEHRAKVGTLYKQKGREAAIQLGHRLVDPLRGKLLSDLKDVAGDGPVRIYCARGGLRSQLMAEFYAGHGYDVSLLTGGYKSYRNHILRLIGSFRNLIVLSGYTGSGKTEILRQMSDMGAQVLDLEGLAHHKGSAFGSLGNPPQPTSAVFHNRIFDTLRKLDSSKPVWVENESHTIGKVFLPDVLWENMKQAPGVELIIPVEERTRFTLDTYGSFPAEALSACVRNLSRRLGDEEMRRLCGLIEAGDLEPAVESLFRYYDKAYEFGRQKRNCHNYVKIEFQKQDISGIARFLVEHQHAYLPQFS